MRKIFDHTFKTRERKIRKNAYNFESAFEMYNCGLLSLFLFLFYFSFDLN